MKYDFKFIKYQGCGNDFILKDELDGAVTSDEHRSALARFLWNRNFWVGADGILFIEPGEGVDGSMRLFEPAGNEADMCGNGLRCVAAFLMERLGKDEVDVLTKDGVKHITRTPEGYRADMGLIRTTRRDILRYVTDEGLPEDSMLDFEVELPSGTARGSIVNTGEPHIVVFSHNLAGEDMVRIGEGINSDRERFPLGMNINLAEVTGPHSISIRTYERGVYNESMACGTGATACAGVSMLLGKVEEGPLDVATRGGHLTIDVGPDLRAFMIGPAVRVFDGRLTAEV